MDKARHLSSSVDHATARIECRISEFLPRLGTAFEAATEGIEHDRLELAERVLIGRESRSFHAQSTYPVQMITIDQIAVVAAGVGSFGLLKGM